MDTLRPHLREMLRPYLPRVVDSFNDKQLFDKLIENKIEYKFVISNRSWLGRLIT